MIEWTAERLADLDLGELKSLKDNAQKLRNSGIVDLCDAELATRGSKKKNGPPASRTSGSYVTGFHFVVTGNKA